jgi:plasmid stabilization system protein ParE
VTLEVLFRPEAEADIEDAALWYELQRARLGQAFLDEVASLAEALSEQPRLALVVHRSTRRALLSRFPFAMYYRIVGHRLVVLAVMHGSRHPRRWKARSSMSD